MAPYLNLRGRRMAPGKHFWEAERQETSSCKKTLALELRLSIPPSLLSLLPQASTLGPLSIFYIYSKKAGHWSGPETLEMCLQRAQGLHFCKETAVCVFNTFLQLSGAGELGRHHRKGHFWFLKLFLRLQ